MVRPIADKIMVKLNLFIYLEALYIFYNPSEKQFCKTI